MDNTKDPDQIKENLPNDALQCQTESTSTSALIKCSDESCITAMESRKEFDKAVVQEADSADSSILNIGEKNETISDSIEIVQTSGKESEINESNEEDGLIKNKNEHESVTDMQSSSTDCNKLESVQTKIPQSESVTMVAPSIEPIIQPSGTLCNMSEIVQAKISPPETVPMVTSREEPIVASSEKPMVASSEEPMVAPSEEPMVVSSEEPMVAVASSEVPTVGYNSSDLSQSEITQTEDVSTVASNGEPSMQFSETVCNLPVPIQAEINQPDGMPMIALGVQPTTQSSETIAVAGSNQIGIIKPKDVPIDRSSGELNVESTENECIRIESDETDIIQCKDTSAEEPISIDVDLCEVGGPIASATIVIPDDVPSNSNTTEASGSLNATGLSLLAQYDSDDDSDDVQEVPVTAPYQNRFVEIDSDTESDSEPDSDSDDSEAEVRRAIDLGILGAGHGANDCEENARNSRTPKVKGELHLSDLPPIQDLHITVNEEECSELGKIQSIVDQLVIVNSLPGTVPLDLDTVLFLDKGNKVLGEVFDVLGQVSDPMYCVRFNSNKEITEKRIEVGQTVYVAPRTQHTQFIVLANLMKLKGSDASWENDIEPPERYLDYSDDEEERSARRTLRNKNRPMEADDEAPKRQRPAEGAYTNHGSSQPPRPYRRNISPWQPHYQPPSNYNMAGGSWHSNYYQNYVHPHYPHHQYRMPIHPQCDYRYPPPQIMPHPPGAPPSGLVPNPYAMFPPPQLMQQPLFPPPTHQPPPPPPHGGY